MPAPILIASMMRREGETGVQTHVRAVYDWLAREGRPVSLVTPFDSPRWQVYPVFGLRWLIDRVSKTASVWWYQHWHAFFLLRALHQRLADGKPCVIYAQCPFAAEAALRVRRSRAQKVAMVVHFNVSQADEWADKGMIARDGRLFQAIRQHEADILPQLDALVYVSDFMRGELQRRIAGLDAVRSRVIPNFLADPGAATRPLIQADLITVGTLEARKNQRYALEIVHAATLMGRPLSLVVAGDGPDRAMLGNYVKDKGLGEQVRFLGFVPHAAALMPGHRACLHVARMESFGIVLIEAMSRGLPVFAPQAGGMPEVFNDGVEGRLIPLDNAPAAARLIIEWLDDEARLQQAGAAARQHFLDRFEADRVAAELVDFFEAVAV